MTIDKNECNRDVRTYGDVIRHMTNAELALFLNEIQAEIELGILAVMRAKMYPHRKVKEEPRIETKSWSSFYSFMEHRVKNEEENYGDAWGVENWQDLMQWESDDMKNFGMDVVY